MTVAAMVTEVPVRYGKHQPIPPGASCAACGTQESPLVTEHCHKHGWVRGFACTRCNRYMSYIDRRILPRTKIVDALIALAACCPDCPPVIVADLGPGPRRTYAKASPRVRRRLPRTCLLLSPQSQEALDRTAEHLGVSKTDVINRAIQAYAFLERQAKTGGKILVQRGRNTEEVRFL